MDEIVSAFPDKSAVLVEQVVNDLREVLYPHSRPNQSHADSLPPELMLQISGHLRTHLQYVP